MQSNYVPNISEFLVGVKTADYDEEKYFSRNTGRFEVAFTVRFTKTYKVRAKTKHRATELAKNRLRKTNLSVNTRHKMVVETVKHMVTRGI